MSTIRDVAALAGVSVTTVSIVLNGQARNRSIPQSTCDRVHEAVKALNYQPSRAARALRGKLRPTIALLWVLDGRSTFFMRIAQGVAEVAANPDQPFDLIVLPYKNGHIKDVLPKLRDHELTAILVGAPVEEDQRCLEESDLGKPVCFINRYSEKLMCCRTDIRQIGALAVDYALQHGCRTLAVVTMANAPTPKSTRRDEILSACAKKGVVCPPSYYVKTENSISGGMDAAMRLAALPDRPDMIFCDNELVALGVSAGCRAVGITDIPLLAIGLSFPDLGRHLQPALDLIDIPGETLGREAASMLVRELAGKLQLWDRRFPCQLLRA